RSGGGYPLPCLPEPDVRFSRIRLSTQSVLPDRSRQLTRLVLPVPVAQQDQTQVAQQRVGNSLIPPARADPPGERRPQPLTQVAIQPLERRLIRAPDPFEIPMPAAQERIQLLDHRPQPLVLRQPLGRD